MRIIYALLFVLFYSSIITAQIEVAPAGGNPILRQVQKQENAEFVSKYGDYAAVEKVDCPPNIFFENTVLAGNTLSIPLDTVGSNLMGDSVASTQILACSNITNGSALGVTNDGTRIFPRVFYTANQDVIVGYDTLCIQMCSFDNVCDTLFEPIFIKRAGQSYDVVGPTVDPFSVEEEFCVDADLLEGELACSEVIFCQDTYDGEGEQLVQPTLFNSPVNCLFYQSSGFPGEDLVCFVMCDEFTICDTFFVTYTITSETLDLPFFEDFSNNGSPYPSQDYWLDQDVYINNTYAPNPPSIGMATFDGLDKGGSPYQLFGRADDLTSKRINLGIYDGSEDLYFKCYVAPKGYGLYPNSTDSLVLEFRTLNGDWEYIHGWNGTDLAPEEDSTPFQFYSYKIEDAAYLHDAFQFRFFNHVSPGGVDDLWHVDYIKIDINEAADSISNDVAFVYTPASLLEEYTAMPWKQFNADISGSMSSSAFESRYFNHSIEAKNVSAASSAIVSNLLTGTELNAESTVSDATSVSSQEYITVSRDNGSFRADLITALQNLPNTTEAAELSFSYEFTNASQADYAFRNDRTQFTTHLDDYYAYDDGTAELSVVLINQQNDQPEFAIRYDTNVEAALRAVRLQFPHLSSDDASLQFFNIKVWVNTTGEGHATFLDNNEPAYAREFISPVYPDSFADELQAFTTYALVDEDGNPSPLTIPAGASFYIGFQQVSISDRGIPVGLDVQNSSQANTYTSFGGEWFPSPIAGAIAYRPVFGDVNINDSSSTTDLLNEDAIQIFPNPSFGLVNLVFKDLNYSDFSVRVLSTTGQHLRTIQAQEVLNLSDLPQGIYHLEFTDNNSYARYFRKVVIAK